MRFKDDFIRNIFTHKKPCEESENPTTFSVYRDEAQTTQTTFFFLALHLSICHKPELWQLQKQQFLDTVLI